MRIIDLTLPIPKSSPEYPRAITAGEVELKGYTALVYDFRHDGMAGTYIDLPGHIVETDDGQDFATYPARRLFRIEATIVRLNRQSASGAVGADELESACPHPFRGGALVINALGEKRFDEIEYRSVWLGGCALEWIIAKGIHLLVSDIYESRSIEGVFPALFKAGIGAVCHPLALSALTSPYARVTALPMRYETATQAPCRLLAELR